MLIMLVALQNGVTPMGASKRCGVPFFSLSLATQTSTANVSAVFSGSPLAVETLTQERRSNERTSLRRSK